MKTRKDILKPTQKSLTDRQVYTISPPNYILDRIKENEKCQLNVYKKITSTYFKEESKYALTSNVEALCKIKGVKCKRHMFKSSKINYAKLCDINEDDFLNSKLISTL